MRWTLDTYVRPIQDINIDGELSIGSTVTLTPSFVAGYSGDGIIDTNDVARVEYQIAKVGLVADEPPFSASFELTYRCLGYLSLECECDRF